jgi:hypothetical protein
MYSTTLRVRLEFVFVFALTNIYIYIILFQNTLKKNISQMATCSKLHVAQLGRVNWPRGHNFARCAALDNSCAPPGHLFFFKKNDLKNN